jgi:hypothetical protein
MAWQRIPSDAGEFVSIMDGQVWKNLRCKDGSLFFDPGERKRLRIGIFMNLDWCDILFFSLYNIS